MTGHTGPGGVRGHTGWWGTVLEAPDGPALARFYARLLGWEIDHEEPGYAAMAPPGSTAYLGFQTSGGFVPPVWPPVEGAQRMTMHVDVGVAGLDAAVADAVAMRATPAGHQPQDDIRVMLDPAGHPFCLYLDE